MRLTDFSSAIRLQHVAVALNIVLQDLCEPSSTIDVAREVGRRLEETTRADINLICQIMVRRIAPSNPFARQSTVTRGRSHWTWSPKNWTGPQRAVELAWRGKLYDSAEALAAAKATADWDVEL